MSDTPHIRRTDKLMSEDGVRELISQAYCGRLATVGADGWPYVIPLLYVWMNGEIWVHNTSARGHFRANVDHDPRVCFELDDPGDVFAYGRFECDTSIAYRSVLVFGRIRVIEDRNQKEAFFDALMQKYGDPGSDRPKGFYPRLGLVTVYAIAIDRMTGKQTPLPAAENRWPAADHTKTPDAVPEKPARRPVAADPPQSPRRAGRRPRSDITKPGDDR
jgi:nitroimidazol reductase NimA-like FMN-containing flavoprotein (pyridoxamine 5'-phosphate oxidase superfamily)